MSIRIAFHLAMSWVLFLLAGALVCMPAYMAIRSSISESAALPTNGWVMLCVAAIGLGIIVVLVYATVHLFLRLWFSYLHRLSTTDRRLVEEKLPGVLNIAVMQPQYNVVHKRYFPNDA